MKNAGKRFAKSFIRELSNEVLSRIQSLEKDQLNAVIKRAMEMSESNCGWNEYWMKDILLRFASDEKKEKKKRFRNSQKTKP